MRISEATDYIEEYHWALRFDSGKKAIPKGYRYWINKERTVLVQLWPSQEESHRQVAVLHRRKVEKPRTRKRRSVCYEPIPWTTLVPGLLVSKERAILVALDLVGHLARVKREEPSMMAVGRLLKMVARMYGWDEVVAQTRLTPESFKARREAARQGDE